jgi:hypothetical protein
LLPQVAKQHGEFLAEVLAGDQHMPLHDLLVPHTTFLLFLPCTVAVGASHIQVARQQGEFWAEVLAGGQYNPMHNSLVPHNMCYFCPVSYDHCCLSQVAKQQGEFLAEVLAGGQWDKHSSRLAMKPQQPAFKYFHKGSLVSICMCYVFGYY